MGASNWLALWQFSILERNQASSRDCLGPSYARGVIPAFGARIPRFAPRPGPGARAAAGAGVAGLHTATLHGGPLGATTGSTSNDGPGRPRLILLVD